MLIAFAGAVVPGVVRAQTPSVDLPLPALVEAARRDLDTYWQQQIRFYISPLDVVMIKAPADTDCGRLDLPTARYCGHTIYWDVTLFTNSYKLGDFAPVFILAHEWSHLVQKQLGLDRPERGLSLLQRELQADCLAGTWASDANKRGLLDPGDVAEAKLVLERGGNTPNTPWFEANAHGNPSQRFDTFSYGFQGNACADAAFFEFLKRQGSNPTTAPQKPKTDAVSLMDQVKQQVGRFKLMIATKIKVADATDAITAEYKTPDGIELDYDLVALRSSFDAQVELTDLAEIAKKQGYTEVRRQFIVTPEKIALGMVIVFQGQTEIVYWTNKHLVGTIEGPRDVAWELYNELRK